MKIFAFIALALIATTAFGQDDPVPQWQDACSTQNNETMDGYLGYNDNDELVCVAQTSTPQQCFDHLESLTGTENDGDVETPSNSSNIISYCYVDGSDYTIGIAFHKWSTDQEDCQWSYELTSIDNTEITFDDNEDQVLDNTNVPLYDSLSYANTYSNDGSSSGWLDTFEWSVAQSAIFGGSDAQGWSVEETTNDDNEPVFKYTNRFSFDILYAGQVQHTYQFDTAIIVERGTSATQSLSVTKTLVEGACCQNELDVVSDLSFCAQADPYCATAPITEIERNQKFSVLHYLDYNDADTAVLGRSYFLYPDEVTIGPFTPVWHIPGLWYELDAYETYSAGGNAQGISIVIQSNVAFTAAITVKGKLYDLPADSSEYRPHTLFSLLGGYQDSPDLDECLEEIDGTVVDPCPFSRRRVLQSNQQGQSQMSVTSQPITFTEPAEQDNNNTSNGGSDDSDNTVVIAVVVALVAVIAIAGIIGGVYYCKTRNNKQSNYNADVKNMQSEQQA